VEESSLAGEQDGEALLPALPASAISQSSYDLGQSALIRRVLLPRNLDGRILKHKMGQPICTKCGAELISGTSYCRQCGQPTDESAPGSELATAILGESKDAFTTKRLDSRPTTPGYDPGSDSLLPTATLPDKSGYSWPKLVTAGILVLLLVVVSVGVIWSLRAGSRAGGAIQINKSLMYPGSRTIVDMSDSGGAVLQMETPDALENVRAWYEANLKPTKTLRVTSASVIQKKENVTVTLVSEDKLTSIVIKQVR
jgi:hypothetical protein